MELIFASPEQHVPNFRACNESCLRIDVMHGLTTIAAIPRAGGAGMALRGETNIRTNPGWGLFTEQQLREAISLAWMHNLPADRKSGTQNPMPRPTYVRAASGFTYALGQANEIPDISNDVLYRQGM